MSRNGLVHFLQKDSEMATVPSTKQQRPSGEPFSFFFVSEAFVTPTPYRGMWKQSSQYAE